MFAPDAYLNFDLLGTRSGDRYRAYVAMPSRSVSNTNKWGTHE